MPIASLVLHLDEREDLRRHALGCLVSDSRIDIGTPMGCYLPVVLDVPSADEGRDFVESLLATPGVLGVDLLGVDFSDVEVP